MAYAEQGAGRAEGVDEVEEVAGVVEPARVVAEEGFVEGGGAALPGCVCDDDGADAEG